METKLCMVLNSLMNTRVRFPPLPPPKTFHNFFVLQNHEEFEISLQVSLSHLAQAQEFSKIEYLAPPP